MPLRVKLVGSPVTFGNRKKTPPKQPRLGWGTLKMVGWATRRRETHSPSDGASVQGDSSRTQKLRSRSETTEYLLVRKVCLGDARADGGSRCGVQQISGVSATIAGNRYNRRPIRGEAADTFVTVTGVFAGNVPANWQ